MNSQAMFTYTPSYKDGHSLFLLKQALKYVSICRSGYSKDGKLTAEEQTEHENKATLGPLNKLPTKDPIIPNPYAFFIDIPPNHQTVANLDTTLSVALIGDYRIALTDKLGEHKIDLLGNLTLDRKFNVPTFTLPTIITKQPTRFILLQNILDLLGGITKQQFEEKYKEIKVLNAKDIEMKNPEGMDKPLLSYFKEWFPQVSEDEYFFIHSKIAYIRFGALLIAGGSRVLDDYWEQLLTNQGFTFRDRVFFIPNNIIKKAEKVLGTSSSYLDEHKYRSDEKTNEVEENPGLESPFNYIIEQPSMELKKAYCNYQQQDLYFQSVDDEGGEPETGGKSDIAGDAHKSREQRLQYEKQQEDQRRLLQHQAYEEQQSSYGRRGAGRPGLINDVSQVVTVASLKHIIVSGQNITGGIELSSHYKVPRYSTRIAFSQAQHRLDVPVGSLLGDEPGGDSGSVVEQNGQDTTTNYTASPTPMLGLPVSQGQTTSSAQPDIVSSSNVSTSNNKSSRILAGLLGDSSASQKIKSAVNSRRFLENSEAVEKNLNLNIDPWKFETLSLRVNHESEGKFNSKGLPIFENEKQLKNRLKKLTPHQIMELSHQHDTVQMNAGITKLAGTRDEKWEKYWLHKVGLPLVKDKKVLKKYSSIKNSSKFYTEYLKNEITNYEKVVFQEYDAEKNEDTYTLEKREPGVNFKGCSNIEGFRPAYSISPDES